MARGILLAAVLVVACCAARVHAEDEACAQQTACIVSAYTATGGQEHGPEICAEMETCDMSECTEAEQTAMSMWIMMGCPPGDDDHDDHDHDHDDEEGCAQMEVCSYTAYTATGGQNTGPEFCAEMATCDVSECTEAQQTDMAYWITMGCPPGDDDHDDDDDEGNFPACTMGCVVTPASCDEMNTEIASGCASTCTSVETVQAAIALMIQGAIDGTCVLGVAEDTGNTWATNAGLEYALANPDPPCLMPCAMDGTLVSLATCDDVLGMFAEGACGSGCNALQKEAALMSMLSDPPPFVDQACVDSMAALFYPPPTAAPTDAPTAAPADDSGASGAGGLFAAAAAAAAVALAL